MGGGFCGGQAAKKLAEAYGTHNLGDVLGAINYAAGEYLFLEKKVNAELTKARTAGFAANLCATEVMEREQELMEKRGMVPQEDQSVEVRDTGDDEFEPWVFQGDGDGWTLGESGAATAENTDTEVN